MNTDALARHPFAWIAWRPPAPTRWRETVSLIGAGLLLTAAFTPLAMGIQTALALHDFHIFFLIPVVVAATRYGLSAALASALASTAASAFFFHPPIYSLKIISPSDVMALAVFIVVALITSQLAAAARENAAIAARNFRQLELLYGFSRQLTGASGPEEIVQAIRQHVSGLVGSPVTIITDGPDDTAAARAAEPDWLPDKIRKAIGDFRSQPPGRASILVSDADTQKSWLLRALTRSTRPAGVLIVELEPATPDELENLRLEVDRLLDEAVGTLDRLDLATTVADAEARRKSEALRDAIIGSASHSLRTPLASILGAASVLSASPPVANDPRLAPLAQMIVSEAERLNSDIQKMLDAAALSSSQLKPQLGWMEPADLVNAALEYRQREVAQHHIAIDYEDNPPLVQADPVLISNALGLVIDNAARYSPPGTEIRIGVRSDDGYVTISVEDEGIGLDTQERTRVFDKFYRGNRVRETTRGTGLGLWIASAFVTACQGRISASLRDNACGTRISMSLVAASAEEMMGLGDDDE